MCFNLDASTYYGHATLDDYIRTNVIDFLKYGLIEIGAYYNIGLDRAESRLHPVLVTGLTPYTVWGSAKSSWIWEATGVTLKFPSGTTPIQITGIQVNSVVYATGTAVLGTGYYIDYSRGRVVFDYGLPSTAVVKVPHSTPAIEVYSAETAEYRKLTYDWLQATPVAESFDWRPQAYLPAIFVDIIGYRTLRGVELGSRAKTANIVCQFDAYSANPYDQNKIMDICYMLETKKIFFYDVQNAPKPLDQFGRLRANPKNWSELVRQYPYGDARFMENAVIQKDKTNPYLPVGHNICRIGMECDVSPVT